MSDQKWYALHLRSNAENNVHRMLVKKGVEAFLPLLQVRSRRVDRRKMLLVPMVPGYLFVRTALDPADYYPVIQTPGVIRIVSFQGRPQPAEEEEIAALHILHGTDRAVERVTHMRRGDRVRIAEGPFKGLVGYYKQYKRHKNRVVVSLDLLKTSLSVEIEDWAVETLT